MKVSKLIEQRQAQWKELDQLCSKLQNPATRLRAQEVDRFSALYRAACADLALASSYQLPPATVEYLHNLVARAHNQLYRSRRFQWNKWGHILFVYTPQKIFNDVCVQIAFFIFWGLFLSSAYLAYDVESFPTFAERVLGEEQMYEMERNFADFDGRTYGENASMAGFYVFNNAGIGLQIFALMTLVVPGFAYLGYNGVALGASFGFMFRPENAEAAANFKNFVTAHGPFELTAIVLSAGAGLRLGISWIRTNGLTRLSSLYKAGQDALPIAMAAVALFVMAAMIEGFLSPTPTRFMPWWVKGLVAVISCALMGFYFVVLGFPRGKKKSGGPA